MNLYFPLPEGQRIQSVDGYQQQSTQSQWDHPWEGSQEQIDTNGKVEENEKKYFPAKPGMPEIRQ